MSAAAVWDPWADEREASVVVPEGAAKYRRAGNDKTYAWAGRLYTRVTEILSLCSGGHLMNHYAKVAALRAAAPLVHAGLYTPAYAGRSGQSEAETAAEALNRELEQYVDGEAIRVIDQDDAIRSACDWAWNMREAERYRDHKARIGSVVHHAMYHHALGLARSGNLFDHVLELAARPGIWKGCDDLFERYDALGKSRESIYIDLAHHAIPYIEHAYRWTETFKPEYEALGLEAVVINTHEEYAGTLDGICRIRKSNWEAGGLAWPFAGLQSALVVKDDKTSKSLPQTVRYQLAAYARASFIGLMSDETEHVIPDTAGMMAVHIRPDEPVATRVWAGREKIDAFYEAFCLLNGFFRSLSNLPRANQSRVYRERKNVAKGERPCPISVGGGF